MPQTVTNNMLFQHQLVILLPALYFFMAWKEKPIAKVKACACKKYKVKKAKNRIYSLHTFNSIIKIYTINYIPPFRHCQVFF